MGGGQGGKDDGRIFITKTISTAGQEEKEREETGPLKYGQLLQCWEKTETRKQ